MILIKTTTLSMDQIKSLRGCFVCVVSVCGLFSVGEH
jgi:hypothetical protein